MKVAVLYPRQAKYFLTLEPKWQRIYTVTKWRTTARHYYTNLYNRCRRMRLEKLPCHILDTLEMLHARDNLPTTPKVYNQHVPNDRKDLPQDSELGGYSGTARWWVLRTP